MYAGVAAAQERPAWVLDRPIIWSAVQIKSAITTKKNCIFFFPCNQSGTSIFNPTVYARTSRWNVLQRPRRHRTSISPSLWIQRLLGRVLRWDPPQRISFYCRPPQVRLWSQKKSSRIDPSQVADRVGGQYFSRVSHERGELINAAKLVDQCRAV